MAIVFKPNKVIAELESEMLMPFLTLRRGKDKLFCRVYQLPVSLLLPMMIIPHKTCVVDKLN